MSIFVKSNITLEEVRPYISDIHAYFHAPFDDSGFTMTEQKIKKAKKEFDEAFTNTVSLVLDITKEEAKTKIKTNNKKGYKYWKYNVEYNVDIKTSKKPIAFSVWMHNDKSITLSVNGRGGCFYLAQNGDIYQSLTTTNEINSVQDIINKINKEEKDKLNKQLENLKDYEKKAIKGIEKIRNKIKKLEKELSKL